MGQGLSSGNEIDTVRQLVARIKKGTITSEQLVDGYLGRIDETDADIQAWIHLDKNNALHRAREMDDIRRRGKPTGELHGIAVGVKDIFDTNELPTQRGTEIYSGRQPDANSAVVERLVEAGAVILGKTATTELAYMAPAATRNPHNLAHMPGGSSSGSAAAVAAGHVPLAIGSQTGGSTIRPASFCGVYGFKPSRGIISRRGALQTSATLDQVGLFANDPGDIALLCDVLCGYDAQDSASYLAPRPHCLEGYLSEVPVEPNFIWLDMPYADRYSADTVSGCDELVAILGKKIDRIPAPKSFSVLLNCHKLIYDYELYLCLENERANCWDQLSGDMQMSLIRAGKVTNEQYNEALNIMAAANDWFVEFFNDYDAILTPSAVGEAPPMGQGTGDPICCTIWTLCGLPCLSLPLLMGENELPIGVQLVAALNEDDRLFRTSRWLLNYLGGNSPE